MFKRHKVVILDIMFTVIVNKFNIVDAHDPRLEIPLALENGIMLAKWKHASRTYASYFFID